MTKKEKKALAAWLVEYEQCGSYAIRAETELMTIGKRALSAKEFKRAKMHPDQIIMALLENDLLTREALVKWAMYRQYMAERRAFMMLRDGMFGANNFNYKEELK